MAYPPPTVVLPQTGFFVGADDVSARRTDHVYRRAENIDGRTVYRFESARPTPGVVTR